MKTLLLSALCAFFMSSVYAADNQSLADKAKELIKQDRQAKERQQEQAAQYAVKLITGKKP